MRKILLSFLTFMMLMPGLACGPFIAAHKAQAAPVMKGMEDCASMHISKNQKSQDSGNKVFFKDCLKIDLFNADHVNLQNPSIDGKALFAIAIIPIANDNFLPISVHAIRGPPPDWPNLSQTLPPILLTTQRLRI